MKGHTLAVAATLVLCAAALAMQAAEGPAAQPKLVIRTYNVSDLVRPARSYPLDSAILPPTRLGQPAQAGLLLAGDAPGPMNLAALVRLIQEIVDPDSWDAAAAGDPAMGPMMGGFGGGAGGGMMGGMGGAAPGSAGDPAAARLGRYSRPGAAPGGYGGGMAGQPMPPGTPGAASPAGASAQGAGSARIRAMGNVLVVAQTEENHKQIAELLGQLRKETSSARMVTVRITGLLVESGEALNEVLKTTAGENPAPNALAEVDLKLAAEKLGDDAIHFRAQTTSFNGQTVHVASGKSRTVVHSAEPVVGGNAVAYDIKSAIVQGGAAIQLTPLLAADGKTVVVDIESVLGAWLPSPPDGGAGGPAAAPAAETSQAIDRLNMLVQQYRTTVRLPVGKAILIGGMTLDPSPEGDGEQLYLVMEVTAAD